MRKELLFNHFFWLVPSSPAKSLSSNGRFAARNRLLGQWKKHMEPKTVGFLRQKTYLKDLRNG